MGLSKNLFRKIGVAAFGALFVVVGINHFLQPENFYILMPPYFVFPQTLNLIAGSLEILGGIGLLFNASRKYAAIVLFLLLLAFLTVHVHMIKIAPFYLGSGLHVSVLTAWVRLVLQGPLLYAAWRIYKTN